MGFFKQKQLSLIDGEMQLLQQLTAEDALAIFGPDKEDVYESDEEIVADLAEREYVTRLL